jgi:hypothetical protein
MMTMALEMIIKTMLVVLAMLMLIDGCIGGDYTNTKAMVNIVTIAKTIMMMLIIETMGVIMIKARALTSIEFPPM